MKLCWTDNYIPSSSRPKWRWLSRPGRRLKILCWSLFKSRNSTFANVGCLSFKNFCVILQLEAEHFCRSLKIKLWKSVNICEGNLDWDHADFLEVFQVLIDLPRHTPPCQSLWLWKFSIFNQPASPHQSGTPCSALWNIFHLYRQKFNKYKVF